MTETPERYTATPHTADLDFIMTEEQIRLFASKLAGLIKDPGWGCIKIVVVDGKIENIKVEKSYLA
jgi:hypothetical protein